MSSLAQNIRISPTESSLPSISRSDALQKNDPLYTSPDILFSFPNIYNGRVPLPEKTV